MEQQIKAAYKNKIYNTNDFFISHLINYTIYGSYLKNGLIYDTFEIKLNK